MLLIDVHAHFMYKYKHVHEHVHVKHELLQLQLIFWCYLSFIMVALWNRADHYIFILSFVLVLLLLLFFLA